MAKETGFANFTPKQAKEFSKEQQKNEPQDPYAGVETNKEKQQVPTNEVK